MCWGGCAVALDLRDDRQDVLYIYIIQRRERSLSDVVLKAKGGIVSQLKSSAQRRVLPNIWLVFDGIENSVKRGKDSDDEGGKSRCAGS